MSVVVRMRRASRCGQSMVGNAEAAKRRSDEGLLVGGEVWWGMVDSEG